MFTGLIFNSGTIVKRTPKGKGCRLFIKFEKSEKNIQTGESIAVNGVCLTVAQKSAKGFFADVIPETLQATTLGKIVEGQKVHLERALSYQGRVGGHFVTGHVDSRVKLIQVERVGRQKVFLIHLPRHLAPFIAVKGAITLDGVSLTVQEAASNAFKVVLIPHTLKKTTFADKKAGDELNLEVDMLARYAAKKAQPQPRRRKIQAWIRELRLQGF